MDKLNQRLQSINKGNLVANRAASNYVQAYPNGRLGFEGSEDDDAGTGLVNYWRILVRNRQKILFSSIGGLLIGLCIGIPMQPIFRARTSLEVLILNDDFMNMKQANPTTTNDNSYDTSEEQTQAKLLESAALIKRVAAKLDPSGQRPTKPKAFVSTGWRKIFHLPDPVDTTERQTLVSKAASSLKVRPTARTRVLEITIDSADPQLATDFANTLTQEYMAQSMEARWNSTQRTSEWLRKELDDTRDKLRHSEDALQTYARGSGLIFTDETTNVATEKLQQVQQQLSQATAERIARQSRFELAQSSPPDSLADVLNDPSLRETQSKINDLRRQIADLGALFNSDYPKIQRLQAELESLQSASEHSRSDILARIKNDFQESNRKEKLLLAAYDAQAQNVTGQDEKAIQYNILKRDVDSNRQLYDTMLQQMKQASIASAMRASNIRVVDPADLPTAPVFPNFKLNSLLGLMGGFFLSVIVVAIRDRADRTLQQPGDIKLWLELPELGTIPSASRDAARGLYGSKLQTLESAKFDPPKIESARQLDVPYSLSNSVELATFQQQPALIGEAFRSALTSILFVGESGTRPRVLVLTSANAADGKTTVASNLAIAAAEIRCKVLVIDADLRRPRMHQVFGVSNESGLTDLLRSELQDNGQYLVQKTAIPYLDVLPAGPPTHAAAHLLYSPNFAAILDQFRTEYDMIFIDTPPMLQMTDARVAARLADAVILVARAGKTTRDAVLAAKERLEEDQTPVLGTVLNDWNPKHSTNGYYDSYYSKNYGARHATNSSR